MSNNNVKIPNAQSKITRDPFPASKKIYVEGSLPGVYVRPRQLRPAPRRS